MTDYPIRSVSWVLFAALFLFLAPARAEQPLDKELAKAVQGLPQEIVDFAARAEGCYIWSHEGSEGDDRRTEEIKQMFAKLRCSSISIDKSALHGKYKDNKPASDMLDFLDKKFQD